MPDYLLKATGGDLARAHQALEAEGVLHISQAQRGYHLSLDGYIFRIDAPNEKTALDLGREMLRDHDVTLLAES